MPENKVLDTIKAIFADKQLSYDDFNKAVEDNKINLADLNSGGYVNKSKYNEDLEISEKKFVDLEISNKDLIKNIEKLKGGLSQEEIDSKINEIKEAHKLEIKQREEAHASFVKTSKINDAIRGVGGNPDLLVPYMNANGLMDKVSIDGENIIGLNDVLGVLKTTPATSGLFPSVTPPNVDPTSTITSGQTPPAKKEFKTLKDIMDNLDEAEANITEKEKQKV